MYNYIIKRHKSKIKLTIAKKKFTVFNSNMSTFGDYKLYKKYEPVYSDWKNKRDVQTAKRIAYLEAHPELNNNDDIQRGKTLLRAIDIMDEYSQKRAEDMEVATENVVGLGLDAAIFGGSALGLLLSRIKPINNIITSILKPLEKPLKMNLTTSAQKGGKNQYVKIASAVFGGLVGLIASFPLMAWAAKTEVSASRKGRFEAMKNELNNPKVFAVLTDEQLIEAQNNAMQIKPEKPKNKLTKGFSDSWNTIKDMVYDSKEYKAQRTKFLNDIKPANDIQESELSAEQITKARKDQQLLTKIIEKVDIASQDYAENTELATQTAIISIGAFGGIFSTILHRILQALKVKSAEKISAISYAASFVSMVGFSIFANVLQKEASRVGRYKIKKELLENPSELIYVDDGVAGKMENVSVEKGKKLNIFKFLIQSFKENKEYKKFKKDNKTKEEQLYKAIEQLELSDEQIKDAKRLQKNTFMTFNKIDENSQKYAESIEALGQAIAVPIILLSTAIGSFIAPLIAFKKAPVTSLDKFNANIKMFGIFLLSTFPSILMNAYITKQQKKASRVADMMSINELSDYKQFL